MKLPRIDFLFVLCIAFFSCDTKGDFKNDFKDYFVKYYGEDGNQEGVDVIVTDGDSVVMLGTTRLPSGSSRIVLTKVDTDGTIKWDKRFGGTNENAKDLEVTADGDFLILSNMFLGTDPSTNEPIYDFKVIKVSKGGDKLDSAVFKNNDGAWKTQFMYSITALSDGGFFVTGNSTDETEFIDDISISPSSPDREDIVYVRYAPDFRTHYQNVDTPGEHFGSGIKIFETYDATKDPKQSFYLFLSSDQVNPPDQNDDSNFYEWIISSSSTLGLIPDNDPSPAGTNNYDEVLSYVCRDPFSNGYFEIGTQSNRSQTYGTLYFSKRNADRVITDANTIVISGDLKAVAASPATKTVDGFLIVANESLPTGTVIRLVTIDLNGKVLWSTSFGSESSQNTAANVAELPDGRILVLGTVQLETQKKMALMKVNTQGKFLN